QPSSKKYFRSIKNPQKAKYFMAISMAVKQRMTNQEIEKDYFEMFREDYPLPPGKTIHDDKPDFTIDGEKLIGIEMTNFYIEKGNLPESEQRQRDVREEAVLEAQRIYEGERRKKFEITFSFDKANPILNKKELVNNLVALARSIENFETGMLDRDFYKTIPELEFVYLNAKEYDDAKWRVTQVYTGTIMSKDGLLEIVKSKEGKSKGYKQCDAYWLLVIVDFSDSAQDQEIRGDGFDKIETDVFEKVIIYKTVFRQIIELQCIPSIPSGDSSKGTPDICN
ncbi:hypothetical protein MNBD_NITROSPINAE04-667, partial [hydrothermal vent metagenome]